MSSLDHAEVEHIADLVRIALTKEEVGRYAKELTHILQYVEQLGAVDTTGIHPKLQVNDFKSVLREDIVTNQPSPKALLANAPLQENGLLKVKAVL